MAMCAETPDAWFGWLAAAGTQAVTLAWVPSEKSMAPDRMLAGFVGGGGTWFVRTSHARQAPLVWHANWSFSRPPAPQQGAWTVSYCTVPYAAALPAAAGLQQVHEQLTEALTEIHAFAQAHDCGSFAECFSQALDALSTHSRHGYHRDLAPDGVLDATAAAILDACESAWVFAGMGSWNDLSFKGREQEDYDRLSERLFQVLIGAIRSAVNDFPLKRGDRNAT